MTGIKRVTSGQFFAWSCRLRDHSWRPKIGPLESSAFTLAFRRKEACSCSKDGSLAPLTLIHCRRINLPGKVAYRDLPVRVPSGVRT